MTSREERVQKLARTLISSGLVFTRAEAEAKARDMLKVPAPEDASSLPKVEDISSAGDDLSFGDVVEEDSKKVYGKRSPKP